MLGYEADLQRLFSLVEDTVCKGLARWQASAGECKLLQGDQALALGTGHALYVRIPGCQQRARLVPAAQYLQQQMKE